MNLFDAFATNSGSNIALFMTKITMILATVWLSHRVLRHSNPRWRILGWRISVVGLMCVAIFSITTPLFNLPLLPAVSTEIVSRKSLEPPIIANSSTDVAASRSPSAGPGRESGELLTERIHHDAVLPATAVDAKTEQSTVIPLIEGKSAPPDVVSPAMQNPLLPDWSTSTCFLAVWSIGALLGIAKILAGFARVKILQKSASQVPERVESVMACIAARVRYSGRLSVKQSDAVASPCSVGLLHNTILLPRAMCEKSRSTELRAVLAHEIAHFAGNDLRWNYLLHVVSALLWFHPLVWRIRLARKLSCPY